ncbi:hypothetical protein F4780DRAFT_762768, partial [Xylariomycetidae sp. FL0641]
MNDKVFYAMFSTAVALIALLNVACALAFWFVTRQNTLYGERLVIRRARPRAPPGTPAGERFRDEENDEEHGIPVVPIAVVMPNGQVTRPAQESDIAPPEESAPTDAEVGYGVDHAESPGAPENSSESGTSSTGTSSTGSERSKGLKSFIDA